MEINMAEGRGRRTQVILFYINNAEKKKNTQQQNNNSSRANIWYSVAEMAGVNMPHIHTHTHILINEHAHMHVRVCGELQHLLLPTEVSHMNLCICSKWREKEIDDLINSNAKVNKLKRKLPEICTYYFNTQKLHFNYKHSYIIH